MKRLDLRKIRWTPLSSSRGFIFKKAGDTFTGIYKGFRKTKYRNREVYIHVFDGPAGQPVEIWESAALQNLALIIKGKAVRITYRGLKKSTTSKNKYKDFLLEVEEGGYKDKPGTPF